MHQQPRKLTKEKKLKDKGKQETTMQKKTKDIKDNYNHNSKAKCICLSGCLALFTCVCVYVCI
jgi:hypothetical protein